MLCRSMPSCSWSFPIPTKSRTCCAPSTAHAHRRNSPDPYASPTAASPEGYAEGNVRVGCRTTQPSPGLSPPSVRLIAVAVSEHTMSIHAIASVMPADHPSPAPQSQVVSARNMRRIGRRARAPAARAAAMPDASVESKSTPLTTVVCAAPLNATNACSASACAHEPAAFGDSPR